PPAAGADSEAPTGRIWHSPTTSYYLLVSATILLLALGLVMVLSASTVYSLRDTGGRTPLSGFFSQAKYALMAIPVAVVIAHLPLKWLKALDRKRTRLNSSHASISYALLSSKTTEPRQQ